jgi:hypothetical protein
MFLPNFMKIGRLFKKLKGRKLSRDHIDLIIPLFVCIHSKSKNSFISFTLPVWLSFCIQAYKNSWIDFCYFLILMNFTLNFPVTFQIWLIMDKNSKKRSWRPTCVSVHLCLLKRKMFHMKAVEKNELRFIPNTIFSCVLQFWDNCTKGSKSARIITSLIRFLACHVTSCNVM